jgi:regulator of protease activity HflC (stomatin/prohibitin superfamily)
MRRSLPSDSQPASTGMVILIFGAVLLLVLITMAFAAIHIVPPGHRGVSVRMGKVDPLFRGEGMAVITPFVESVVDIPVKQITQSGLAPSFSSDLQTVTVNYDVLYRLPETKVVELYRDYSGDPYSSLIAPRIQESVKKVTAKMRAEDLVKRREDFKLEVLGELRESLGELLQITDFVVTNLDLSAQLEEAIERKVVAEQDALAAKFVLDKARTQGEIKIVEAEAEAKAVRIKGEAIKSSPEVISLEIAQRWNGVAPQAVSVGSESGGANILLPIGVPAPAPTRPAR